jgi:hypothetical protein
MIRRILVLGGIGIGVTLAQSSTPKPAPAKPATATGKYVPPKTPWGEPDLQGIWPINHLINVGLERNKKYGDRAMMTDDEAAAAQKALQARDERYQTGAIPQADAGGKVTKQTSLIVDPPNGRFPELTPLGKKLQADMKSSYKPGQTVFDAVEDFAAWDHCVTRGMPVSMEPRNYNNGIRIMQSPGYVIILLEMAHEARVIPTNAEPKLDPSIKQWMGESRGHWEGNTLVVETTNFNGLVGQTSAGVPGSPGPLQPETDKMTTMERFTRTAPDTIEYKMTISDPDVLATGSYTIAYPMYLDNKYEFFEYACHEGNTAIRNYIETSRFEREHPDKVGKPTPRGGGRAPQQ